MPCILKRNQNTSMKGYCNLPKKTYSKLIAKLLEQTTLNLKNQNGIFIVPTLLYNKILKMNKSPL